MRSREKARCDKAVRLARRTGDTGYRPITGYRRIAQAAGSLPWLRTIIERDLKDGRIPGSCPQDGHIIEAELRIVRDHRELGMLRLRNEHPIKRVVVMARQPP